MTAHAINALSAADLDAVINRHPEVFKPNWFKQLRGWIVSAAIIIYLLFAWSFFHVGQVLNNGNWDIAGAYLADWVSYEVRPDIEYDDGFVRVEFPRFSPLGSDPQPLWISKTTEIVDIQTQVVATPQTIATPQAAFSFMAPDAGTAKNPSEPSKGAAIDFMAPGAATAGNPVATVDAKAEQAQFERREVTTKAQVSLGGGQILVEPKMVTLTRGQDVLIIDIIKDQSVRARGGLPQWANQKYADGKIVASFGVDGRVEVESDEVKIRRRFFGWENFLFDTNSPFWNKSFGEVMSMIASGDRIKPTMSNAVLAFDNIVNNAEWQHGDVWIKMLQTIVMAFVGTLFATILAFPMAFFAARNITQSSIVNQIFKRFFDFLRSVDMLIWALFFTRAFGPGPLAGMSAIFFTDTGTLGKTYSEALENIDDKQREGIKSLGANPLLVQRFGVLPQVLPVFLSQSLYFWESNTRSATIIGAVGAGGIGLKLWEAMRTNQDWENVFYMVILVLIVVYVFDSISGKLRAMLTKS
ncbi:phosphonate ABC transporter, permease protein PhnE [Cohaesibacter celericrescens]|uniref:Phosphonate ABC transporter, permease protein PhnE n=1 Tax=Cohaesibacter celericrescens TaxID=2067669 RepID=A0A2N5XQX5_9HYPH|nr:phosphonate ABC transporter, permease protein PhnE [Cohaesibacter celericrescens]PLW76904.1 phosphonate ABC transporter, permease protein PhnE [Cohaesibacter celericrescens]